MAEKEQELARDLGFLEAYTLGLGTMIGAGIFVLPGIVAGRAGPASMVSFAIAGVVSLLAALSLSELATGMPKAGGSYYYVNRALGGFFGSIVGWGMWVGLMFATAFYMLGFGQYLAGLHPSIPVVASALVMGAILTLVNYRGVKETGSLQNVIVIALVVLIIAFIAFGLAALDPSLLTPFAPEGWGAVGLTAGTVFVAFIGFEVIATSAEEIKNPGRNLPLSMIAAVVTPAILYVLVMLVSTGVLPIPQLEVSTIPVADVAMVYAGEIGSLAMIFGAVLATVSSANASILSAARVNFAMGRDRILTVWLNQVHKQFRTPYRAILATGIVILLLIAGPLPIDTLADVASFSYLVAYALVHVAVVVMRRADPATYDPDFRIPDPLYPTVPIAGGLGCLAVMIQMRPLVQGIGLAIVGIGVGWYFLYVRERTETVGLVGEAIATDPAGGAGSVGGTGNGDGDGDVYRVVVPVANPDTEETLIRYAAASAHGHDGEAELIAVNVIEVPPQTSPAQIELEEERVGRQRELLESARDTADTLSIPLRTRAIVGRHVGDAILSVIREEAADHVLMGWSPDRHRRDEVFGSTLDTVVEQAPCEVSLVTRPSMRPGNVVALAGGGPNAPVAARRAGEIHRTFEDSSLTLVSVQQPHATTAQSESLGSGVDGPDGSDASETSDSDVDELEDPETVGKETIDDVASVAGLDPDEYESRVVVDENVREALLETVTEYDTVAVGATGENFVARTMYGTIPRDIVSRTDNTVVIARGADARPRSLKRAILERLVALLESEPTESHSMES